MCDSTLASVYPFNRIDGLIWHDPFFVDGPFQMAFLDMWMAQCSTVRYLGLRAGEPVIN